MLAALSHENIVKLIGFVEDLKHQKAWLVLSWEPNGNVRKFLAAGNWEIPERISLVSNGLSRKVDQSCQWTFITDQGYLCRPELPSHPSASNLPWGFEVGEQAIQRYLDVASYVKAF